MIPLALTLRFMLKHTKRTCVGSSDLCPASFNSGYDNEDENTIVQDP